MGNDNRNVFETLRAELDHRNDGEIEESDSEASIEENVPSQT